jgi:hypothetical protein
LLYNQKKIPIEYIYTEDINIFDLEKVGEFKNQRHVKMPPKTIFNRLYESQPEENAISLIKD